MKDQSGFTLIEMKDSKYTNPVVKKLKEQKAFTLIEMVIVLLIITVLMLLMIPNIGNQKKQVNSKGTEALIQVVETQVQLYQLEHQNGIPSIETLIKEGYLKASQAKTPEGKILTITPNGTVKVND